MAALVGTAIAAPAPLTLTEAQRLALARSPQLPAYDAAIAAAQGMAAAAPQLPEPTLALGVDWLPIAQHLTSAEARKALAERYAREADRVGVQKTATRVEIARETALAWVDCLYVEQMTRVAADQLKSAQAEIEGAERMYWAGRSSQSEFYAARSMLVLFEDKSSELEHDERTTRIALKRWVGEGSDAPLAALPNVDRIRFVPAALEGDLVRHPDVALLETQEELAASDVGIARAAGQSAAQVAATLARRDEIRAARAEKLRAEVAKMRIMIDAWQHMRDRRDRYAREIVPLAQERTMAMLAAYRGGKASLVEVLAARRAETEAQMQSLEKARDVARMWVRLNFALPDAVPAAAPGASAAASAQ
jgi:outer membrane protein TolC